MSKQFGGVSFWKTVPDDNIMMIWRDSAGDEHCIPPTFYEENGTPFCHHAEEDMVYVRTEIKIE